MCFKTAQNSLALESVKYNVFLLIEIHPQTYMFGQSFTGTTKSSLYCNLY